GSVGLGGPIVTAGGLVFIAGAVDSYLRAFDVETGRELWKGQLPASGHATPMTYRIGPAGRQYVVGAAGGHAKITEEKLSDALVAFALRNVGVPPDAQAAASECSRTFDALRLTLSQIQRDWGGPRGTWMRSAPAVLA